MAEELFCEYVEIANEVMREHNLEGWSVPYICQKKDAFGNKYCKECVIYRVSNHDEAALSLFR